LGAVVFDEIHYINDADRGQVWEKTILMLPPHIQMVMLSATIDDPKRFAEWCEQKEGSTKQVYLSSTNHRVVPLTHYSYLAVSDSNLKMIKDKQLQQYVRKTCNKIQCIQSEKGKFHESVHQDLVRIRDILDKQRVFTKRKYVLNDLARYLKNQDMLPAIGFVFSRKQVEQCAREMTTNLLEEDSKIPYTVQRECDHIIRRLPNHEEYRQLPEYIELVSLLEKGIGIHHSGMIPILREIVELCISKKCIKLLFATESFAIGLDCPIKTAMFLSLTKFDGNHDRDLHSHEYTQMAGRAGRRGIDTIGHVVHCNNLFKPPPMSIYKGIMCGKPPSLVSKYRISYDMILNVLRTHPEATIDTLIGFTNKSMMFEEVNKEIRAQGRVVAQGAHARFSGIRTPEEVCKAIFKPIMDYGKSRNRKSRHKQKTKNI
jgi:antiviral helicase SKI2